jgi:hypothetical protein
MEVMTQIGVTGERARRADSAFEKAYTAKNQPDSDSNGLGDYGERAQQIQEALAALPAGSQYFTAMHPENLIYQALDKFKKPEDFTEENTRLAIEHAGIVRSAVEKKSEGELKKEYAQWVAGNVRDERGTDDDKLRYLLTEYHDKIPMEKIMKAVEGAMVPISSGGTSISDQGRYKEVSGILNLIYGLVPELRDVAKALKESNEITVRVEDN